nr:DNA-directed DNA polymerase [Tanacetum cinerariifolium]
MLVQVEKFVFPAVFIILQMEEDDKVPLILGRPFLHTADAIIRVKNKELNLRVGDDRIAFLIDKSMWHSHSNNDTLVISTLLKDDEKKRLVFVLKKLKEAFGWRTFDILGISPSFCKHKINFEDDAKPVIQKQRRLNPNMKKVVKKEIIKFLDVEFDIEIKNKKGAEKVAADHLSRFENPHLEELRDEDIDDNFLYETSMNISSTEEDKIPWFADFANYLAGKLLRKEAEALPTNDARVMVNFLKKLFSRFGILKALISDK